MKTYTDELTPIESSVPVYKAANWYEREVSFRTWWTRTWASCESGWVQWVQCSPHLCDGQSPLSSRSGTCLESSLLTTLI